MEKTITYQTECANLPFLSALLFTVVAGSLTWIMIFYSCYLLFKAW